MNLDDYIGGARHGREAHDLELESMRDPLLADALDGFDAVQSAPGGHAAALERIAGRIGGSAAGGRAAARARAARVSEQRVRGWSVAAAVVFLAGVAGGAAWLLRDGISTNEPGTASAGKSSRGGWRTEEVEAILPPVTVIPDKAEGMAEATDMSGMRLDREEVPGLSDIVADKAVDAEPARDTVVTAEFRRYLIARNGRTNTEPEPATTSVGEPDANGNVMFIFDDGGIVTLSFDVDAYGRPRNIEVVESPNGDEAAGNAKELLSEGPDWPTEPAQKLITINI